MEAWYNRAVFYHIYPLGLCGAPKENLGSVEEGEHRLSQLEKWILHIKGIGCTAIYIGPLFESVGHGYETTDYKKIDSRLGNNEDFKEFVKNCHKTGIKIIVDGVFNHTGREFFAFKDLKLNRENSKYKEWYCNVNFAGNNEFNDGFSYDSWGGYNIMPKLNQKNPEVIKYLLDVIDFWVDEFDIDGIRLDAADVLDFDFIHEMRMVANKVKEDFWLMGEVIHGDYSQWANPKMLHSVTNYELHKGLYSGHNDQNYFEIAHTVKRLEGICGDTKLYSFVDNHDQNRIWNRLNKKQHLIPVYILLYSLPGIPSIYYGSEFALAGKKENGSDDGIRPYINLEEYLHNNKNELEEKVFRLICLLGEAKRKYVELTNGKYMEIMLTNRQFCFGRLMEKSAVITAVNNDDNEVQMNITLPMKGDRGIDVLSGEVIEIEGDMIHINVEGNGGRMIHLMA
jgi:cyclomaltodextrinase / maltogenic alpha-amylase / neopullulanase